MRLPDALRTLLLDEGAIRGWVGSYYLCLVHPGLALEIRNEQLSYGWSPDFVLFADDGSRKQFFIASSDGSIWLSDILTYAQDGEPFADGLETFAKQIEQEGQDPLPL